MSVFVDGLSTRNGFDHFRNNSLTGQSDGSSSETDGKLHSDSPVNESESSHRSAASAPTVDETLHIYQAALIKQNALQTTPALDYPWPSTATELTLASAKDTIPIEL